MNKSYMVRFRTDEGAFRWMYVEEESLPKALAKALGEIALRYLSGYDVYEIFMVKDVDCEDLTEGRG